MRPHLTTRAIPLSPWVCLRSRFAGGYLVSHQQPVNQKAEAERYEPRIRIELIEESGVCNSAAGRYGRPHEARRNGKNRKNKRDYSARIHSVAVAVAPVH